MTLARFSLQTLVVLALMAAVSWPELGEVRAVSIWRGHGRADARGGVAPSSADHDRSRAGQFGIGSAAYAPFAGGGASDFRQRLEEDSVEGRRRKAIPPAVLALGGKLNAIVGRARTAMNAPVGYARLALRNLQTGLVEARAIADEAGEFVFLDVPPSGYVVELVGGRDEVLATSESLVIEIGDLRQATVRTATTSALKAMFGSVMEATASEAISAASRDGVTQVTAPATCVSPPCGR